MKAFTLIESEGAGMFSCRDYPIGVAVVRESDARAFVGDDPCRSYRPCRITTGTTTRLYQRLPKRFLPKP